MVSEWRFAVELDVVLCHSKHHTRHRCHLYSVLRSRLRIAVWLHFGDEVLLWSFRSQHLLNQGVVY